MRHFRQTHASYQCAKRKQKRTSVDIANWALPSPPCRSSHMSSRWPRRLLAVATCTYTRKKKRQLYGSKHDNTCWNMLRDIPAWSVEIPAESLSTLQGRVRNTSESQFSIPLHLDITDAMRLPYIDHKARWHSSLTNSAKVDISVKKMIKKKTYIVTILWNKCSSQTFSVNSSSGLMVWNSEGNVL